MELTAKLSLDKLQDSENIAKLLSDEDLGEIGRQTVQSFETDKQSRKRWETRMQDAMELALDIFGADAMLIDAAPEAGGWPGATRDKRREGYPVSPMMSSFFFSRSETIWGGTSQIQRNIVGERVLGLPKEPKPANED